MGNAFRSLENGKNLASFSQGSAEPPPAGTLNDNLFTQVAAPPPWTALLKETIVTEILPILVSAQRKAGAAEAGDGYRLKEQSDVAAFVDCIIADDIEQARAMADRVIVQGGGRDALLHELLTPAAHLLGEMWERDDCDFMTVTLGVYRLDQIMKETATVGLMNAVLSGHEHRILLVPSPGEQHSFGLSMVADVFREGGWCVRSGPAVTKAKLLRLVRSEWFDVVGLSVSSERALKGLPACIRAIRQASCNPSVYVMVGGHAVVDNAERTRFLGANATANNAQTALAGANNYIETTVTTGLHQPKTRLVDIG
jgi:methanogenic corrinoid protein MtbC1